MSVRLEFGFGMKEEATKKRKERRGEEKRGT